MIDIYHMRVFLRHHAGNRNLNGISSKNPPGRSTLLKVLLGANLKPSKSRARTMCTGSRLSAQDRCD